MKSALHREWRSLWTSKRNIWGIVSFSLAFAAIGGLYITANHVSCEGPNGNKCPAIPTYKGIAVNDKFHFVHKTLTGDGSITARLSSMRGVITYPPPHHDKIVSGLVPWAKVGLLIKDGLRQGSSYVALAGTGSHGVHMQSNYTQDTPGSSSSINKWLRLDRKGQTVTGYESVDGRQWSSIGEEKLTTAAQSVTIGLFAASPCDLTERQGFMQGPDCRFATATGSFHNVKVEGPQNQTWSSEDIGFEKNLPSYLYGTSTVNGNAITLTGSGDIGPLVATDGAARIEVTLAGTVIATIIAIVMACSVIAARLKSSSITKGQVAGSLIVLWATFFIVSLLAGVVALLLGRLLLVVNGTPVLPVSTGTTLRILGGTALIVSLNTLFAAAITYLIRRRALAIILSTVLIVLPYVLATTNSLPHAIANFLMTVTPSASFAVQQTVDRYPQVLTSYTPMTGYFPLLPALGLGVLVCYVVGVLGLVWLRYRRA